jgi:hypothetical protein
MGKMLLFPNYPPTPKQNRLLAALPAAEFERLLPHLDLLHLPLDWAPNQPERGRGDVLFPVTAIVSLSSAIADSASTEIAVAGCMDMMGTDLFMAGESTPSLAVVQNAGYGYRLDGRFLKREFARGGVLKVLLRRYTRALITQAVQTAACHWRHSIEQQLCRWVLLRLDRLRSNELIMSQELISNMLGVRGEGVTEAAGQLQNAGIIDYQRDHISVLDRPKLEQRACECYAVVKREYDRLLSCEDFDMERAGRPDSIQCVRT